MDLTLPLLSQAPEFHPYFNNDARTVVLQVGHKCFKVDAVRLARHSMFLRQLLLDKSNRIGMPGEGTVTCPISLDGQCSEEELTSFLLWLEHNPWDVCPVDQLQQLIDVLHVSHMWEIQPGIDYATKEIEKNFAMRPAQVLFLARKYELVDWVDSAVRRLLNEPLTAYTFEDKEHLGFTFYATIASAKEEIYLARKRLASIPPIPKSFDNAPFCDQAKHVDCMRIWAEKWFLHIARRIHSPKDPLPLSCVTDALTTLDHKGMNPGCKEFIINWLRNSSAQAQSEETIIASTVTEICHAIM